MSPQSLLLGLCLICHGLMFLAKGNTCLFLKIYDLFRFTEKCLVIVPIVTETIPMSSIYIYQSIVHY